MQRTGFITHEERQVVFMNLSGITSIEEALSSINEAREFFAAQPRRRNLLTLTDVTGMTQDPKVLDALQDLAEHDKPWVLAGAVVGITPLKRILFRMVMMMSGRKMATFVTVDDAKEWLVRQWVPPSSVPDIAR